ncbi:hypothetical protein O181_052284 [Austropuccinia psidii MF-1]|uniref:Uncharacterized protein n=1 Tax=Austropuccinia psidii MF-1 TaxID=1389203 RepID=A0A9Q3E0C9_9BASI|nr:hypothetical protein [Austropuccinia psidii MF-1]
MTPTISGRNYSIQSHGYGPVHSSQKSKRQECKPRGEAQLEDSRTSPSYQRLASTFYTLIESPEADLAAIPVHNELSSSNEEVHGPRKDRRTSEGLDTHVLQGTSPTYKSLVEKPKHVVRGREEEVGPRKGQQPSGSSPGLQKQKTASTSAKQGQKNTKRNQKGKQKAKGKAKSKWNKPYPQNYRTPKK